MSELRADTITASDGSSAVTLTKQAAAKMFVNIGGDGTPTVTGSFNVSTLTDEATSVVRANMTNGMSDTTFTNLGTVREQNFIATFQELSTTSGQTKTSSSVVMKTHSTSALSDTDGRYYVAFGDLA